MMEVPWLLLGDFNVILHVEERLDFNVGNILLSEENFFVSCIQDLGVMDCSFIGPTFTWSNKQAENFLAKKLERVLVNEALMNRFPTAISEVLEPNFFNHCAYRVEFGTPLIFEAGPFKFFNFLLKHKDFQNSVQEVWSSEGLYGYSMFRLYQKLKFLKLVLRRLNNTHYFNIQGRVEDTRKMWHELQLQALASPSHEAILAVKAQENIASALYQVEESFWKQKSRIRWIKDGGGNFAFFP